MDVFISYSSKDRAWKDRVSVHLETMRRAKVLDYSSWDDSNIRAGDKWEALIHTAIENARVVLLLVSSDFLASEYIAEKEVPAFREGAKKGQLIIVPLMIRPSTWARFPWIAELEHFPKDGALSGMDEHEIEVQLTKLMGEIARLVDQQRMDELEDAAHDEAPAEAEAPAAKAALELFDKNTIKDMVEQDYGKPALDIVLVFKTRRQRTWMAAIPGAIVCVLDDENTRRAHRIMQWREPVTPLTEVRVTRKPGTHHTGRVEIGRRKSWLASLDLYQNDPDILKQRLEKLIAAAAR